MYKVSIIMAIFNTEKYIERSFKSILNQTMDLKDIEVIMVDDLSTDNTRNIVREYEEKYPNFKAVYHKENSGGCAVPRNSGLKVATGEYVMFLDPDDEYYPTMCETMYNKIKNSDAEIVKCNHEMIRPENSKIDYQFDENISELEINCKTDNPLISVSVCNAIHDRAFLKEKNIMFPILKNAEDMVFSTTEFLNANKIIYINYVGYKYYTNSEVSHSMKPSKKNLDAVLAGYVKTKETIEEYGRTEIYYPFFSGTCFSFFIRIMDYPGDKKEYFKQFYEFEKSLNCTLTFKYSWMNIVNKFISKNHITMAVIAFEGMNLIRKTPIIKIYRKSL